MTLIDANVLLYAYNANAPQQRMAAKWLSRLLDSGEIIALPWVTIWAFIRISTNPKAIHAPMQRARELLRKFLAERAAERIPDDLAALDSHPQKTQQVTDFYLAALAEKHGMKLATMDERINHPAVVLVGQLE